MYHGKLGKIGGRCEILNYIYPENLKARPMMWFWSLKHFVILSVGALLSVVCLIYLRKVFPCAAVLVYGFLTIKFF